MASIVRVQRVDRSSSRSFYVNLPAVLADVLEVRKGETFEWILEDKNTLIFRRVKRKLLRLFRTRQDSAKINT